MTASPTAGGDAVRAASCDVVNDAASLGSVRDATRCAWCLDALPAARAGQRFCTKRCRQSAWRLRRRRTTASTNRQPKRIAYADPPFPGMSHYYRDQDSYAGEVDHAALLSSLLQYDGWALSTSSKYLRDVLPLCPRSARVCAWVKPIGVSSATLGLHSTWEPVIVVPARRQAPGLRDWLRAMPARHEGTLLGRKPVSFVHWLFEALGADPAIDDLCDLFPGTGIVGRCWRLLAEEASPEILSDAEASPGDEHDAEAPEA